MKKLKELYDKFKHMKFWIIVTAITFVSVMLLPSLPSEIANSNEPAKTLFFSFFFIVAVFGVCLLPFAIWHSFQRRRFCKWLEENWDDLEEGVMHPDGALISLDTQLIKYKVVFSGGLATATFESRPYIYEHRNSGIAQFIFTGLSLIFGWWFIGLDGVTSTLDSIDNNLRGYGLFTLRDSE